MSTPIALVGAGRMGRGLAVVFAYAGHDVALIDLKPRDVGQFPDVVGNPSLHRRSHPQRLVNPSEIVVSLASWLGSRGRGGRFAI